MSKLCDKFTNLVWEFKLKSRTDLETTQKFLFDGMEDLTLGKLQSTATEGQGMAKAAKQLVQALDELKMLMNIHAPLLKLKMQRKRKDNIMIWKKRKKT